MKKVLLSSVAALAVFAAAAPAFAQDTVSPKEAEELRAVLFNQPAAETPATPATGTHEEANNFTRTNKEDRAKDPAFVGKEKITSQDRYTGENYNNGGDLTAIPRNPYFSQGIQLWGKTQTVTAKAQLGAQTIEVVNPHDGTPWLVDVDVEAHADTPSGFYITANYRNLRQVAGAKAADAKADKKENGKDNGAVAGSKASSAKAGEKSLPKTSAVK
ncbi:LPKTxAVK-anchored surface protein [uncultured Streptococcus sp.]|uniref:LPKTxAVK-anchored surface protein n=1 Tax=uncultured Streptococcus sp. TaxID=83427 RepID=UPI0028EBA3C1|nr:LPKTxAVK-anchored surface protein [uncultured Streptococcus sp.]